MQLAVWLAGYIGACVAMCTFSPSERTEVMTKVTLLHGTIAEVPEMFWLNKPCGIRWTCR